MGRQLRPVASSPDLLQIGIYRVGQAAYLIGVTERRIRGWIDGYADSNAEALIQNDIGWSGPRLALSFRNLMELRFISIFEDAGVKFSHIRSIMNEVREITQHPHPFATNIVFKTDKKRIVGEITKRVTGSSIYDLRTKNYELFDVVYKSLARDVSFDFNGNIESWIPRRSLAPNVIIHPKFSFGQPVLRASKIPTSALAEAVQAEGSATVVAELYELPVRQVREAVKFEHELRKAS